MANEKQVITEGQLKFAVDDFLTYQMNLGKLYFDRLNSGEIIECRGDSRRRVKLCRKGTADFFVLIRGREMVWGRRRDLYQNLGWMPRIIFLELKSKKGRSTPEQGAFKVMVEEQLAEYFIIRSTEELEGILK